MIQKVGESIKNDLKLNMVNGMKNAVNLKEKKERSFFMEDKLLYEKPKLDLILFASADVIATSDPTIGDGSPDFDNTAWA